MFRRIFASTVVLSLFAVEGFSEAARPLLTRENKLPDLYQLEGNLSYAHRDWNGTETDSAIADIRFGLYENLTFRAAVPFVRAKSNGSTREGIGDTVLGLELLAFEDIFRAPFIIPHVSASLKTGDEDKGTGSGVNVYVAGVSVGTKVWDDFTFIVDASYLFNGADEGDSDTFQLAGSVIWDIGPRFAMLAEGRLLEKNDFDKTPYQIVGGAVYKVTPDVSIGAYGGQTRNDSFVRNSEDLVQLRLSVSF
ncbi:MAG TPA: transporter [Kiritimatiellia bacterium]|nr:transporter [Kiritimatiellia bacterium]